MTTQFAQGVDAFDGTALGERPPKISVSKGTESAPGLPSATGIPADVQQSDGLASPRVTQRTLQAPHSRPATSALKPTRANVSTFQDRSV